MQDSRFYVYEYSWIQRTCFNNLEEMKNYYENKKHDGVEMMSYEIIDSEAHGQNGHSWILQLTDKQFEEFIKNL